MFGVVLAVVFCALVYRVFCFLVVRVVVREVYRYG